MVHCYEHGGVRVRHFARGLGVVVGGVFLAVALALALGWLVQLLWNATLAVMFGVTTITYWQAVGLFILAKLFFSLGHHGHAHSRARKFEDRSHHWPGAGREHEHSADFKQYWETEGRRAFEDYLERNKKENEK